MPYEIIHVRPDKREIIVNIEDTLAKAKMWLDTPRWKGTWLTDTRMLLRLGKGEIHIREREAPPKIYKAEILRMQDAVWYELTIKNHPELRMVWINHESLVGFNENDEVIWNTSSFTELSDIVGKELSFECYTYYERLVEEYNLQGAI